MSNKFNRNSPTIRPDFYPLVGCFFTVLLLICAFTLSLWGPPSTQASGNQNFQQLDYQINRSNVPDLFHNDLTLLVNVGAATGVSVEANGSVIHSEYDAGSGMVQFTTSADSVSVIVDNAGFNSSLGSVEKAPLKGNKEWAWSHGFDDNTGLKPSIDAFITKGWAATLFMITSQIDENRQENWIVDQADLITYLNSGWAVGTHGYLNNCDDATEAYQLQAIDILENIISLSNVSDYKLLSFAIPCFNISLYGPVTDSLIANSSVDLEFYESGNSYLRLTDASSVVNKGESLPSFSADDKTAYGVELNGEIGRDFRFEGSSEEYRSAVRSNFDWMATHATSDRHFWYNTLAHGFNEDGIIELLNYLDSNYGPNGTDEVWVAPSTEIYSYILVRDNAVVTLVSSTTPIPPTPTQSPTPVFATPPSDFAYLPAIRK